MHITFAQGYYTIEFLGPRPTQYQWTNRAVSKDLRNYSLNVLGDRESNPGPFARSASGLTTAPPMALGDRAAFCLLDSDGKVKQKQKRISYFIFNPNESVCFSNNQTNRKKKIYRIYISVLSCGLLVAFFYLMAMH